MRERDEREIETEVVCVCEREGEANARQIVAGAASLLCFASVWFALVGGQCKAVNSVT